MRPKISIYIATSIDGYIAREDGSLDWLDRIDGQGSDYGFNDFFGSIDALVLGKNTYEKVMTFPKWPYSGKRVIVLSKSLTSVMPEAELFSGNASDLAAKLHTDGIQHVWIDGGLTISHFLQSGLVDKMTLTIIPVILGSGIPLFNPLSSEILCKLSSSQGYPSGLVQLTYDIA